MRTKSARLLNLAVAATIGIAIGIANTHAAEPARASGAPAAGTHGNASGAPAGSGNAPAARGGAENNAAAESHRDARRAARTVYVPGYGYADWYGNYASPYWNSPGTWYDNNGSDGEQSGTSTSSAGGAAAPAPATRSQEEAARAEMSAARARLAAQFESNDDIRSALRDVQAAQKVFDAAVAKVNRSLKADPAFEEAEAKKQQAAGKVEAAQAAEHHTATGATATQPAPISGALVHSAEEKLNAASEATSIASDRIQADPAVVDAREKLEAAQERLNAQKAKFDAALKSDPQWQAANQKLVAATAAPK